MAPNGIRKWLKEPSRTTDPISKGRAFQVDAFTLKDAGLAI